MINLEKDGKLCACDRDQYKAMEAAGWTKVGAPKQVEKEEVKVAPKKEEEVKKTPKPAVVVAKSSK